MAKLATCFFLLAIIIVGLGCVSSARILLDDETAGSVTADTLGTTYDETSSSTAGTATASDTDGGEVNVDDNDHVADPPLPNVTAPANDVAPVDSSTDTSSDMVAPTVGQQPQMTFFMHDIVGGSHPSVRTVTGVITATDQNAVPFSKPANNIFPLTGENYLKYIYI